MAQGRPLEPADLNAAAPAAQGLLTPEDEAALVVSAAKALNERLGALATQINIAANQLRQSKNALRSALFKYKNALDIGATDVVLATRRDEAASRRGNLAIVLTRVAAFGEPGALRLPSLDVLMAPTDPTFARLQRLDARLTEKAGALSVARQPGGADLAAARAALDHRITALQQALDGEALPILPVYGLGDGTRPDTDSGNKISGATLDDLREWSRVRNRVASMLGAIEDTGTPLKLFAVNASATIDPADAADDARGEDEAPRPRHFGRYIGASAPAGMPRLCGFVADEWTENRPSAQQDAAVALNYNTPDAQAPNAMLLCVPPNPSWRQWSPERATSMVSEVIDLIQMRARSSDQRTVQTALSQDSNTVPYIIGASGAKPRLPERNLLLDLLQRDVSTSGLFVEVNAKATDKGIAATGINLSSGFSGTRKR